MSISLFHPTQSLEGTIQLTLSKSESNRVLMIQALCNEDFEIPCLAKANDTQILKNLLTNKNTIFDVKDAGSVMRFLTAYFTIQSKKIILTGSDRMKQRPIKVLVDALISLGGKIEYLEKEGYPPLRIIPNKLQGKSIELDGSVSSQYISALLLIAPKLKNGLTIHLTNKITSKPYINMTIELMKYFGISIQWENNSIIVNEGNYKPNKVTIESDWSAASYWYGITAISKKAKINLLGLKKESLQGDAKIVQIYKSLGVETTFINEGIQLTKKQDFRFSNLKPIEIDFTNNPDLAQTVAVTCAILNIKTRLKGLNTLRIKETDRIEALKTELNKLGYNVNVENNDLIVNTASKTKLQENKTIQTYKDHRMAMAFSAFALKYRITIEDENVVEKSYPNFWNDLTKVGFIN